MPTAKATNLTASDYVHLHNHTQYSLLDGLTKIPALVDYVAENGMEAVAITDHGTLSGVIEFYKAATDKKIKPIIGLETYIAARSHLEKDPAKDKLSYHLTVLAMNNTGYQNLMRLSTIANLKGFYYKPRIDHELLDKYNEGLIILSGCIGSEVGDNLRNGQYAKAKEIATWYKSVFKDRYYLEIQDHGHPDHPTAWAEQKNVNEQILKIAAELNIPVVVTCDPHYLRAEDQTAHEILLCVQTGSFFSDQNRMSLSNIELHVTSPDDVIKRWGKTNPEVILNSKRIAERCQVNIELGQILIPKFSVPAGETERSYLHKMVYKGLAWRYGKVSEDKAAGLTLEAAKQKTPPSVRDRAAFELKVIDEMNFNGYFLIIQDFINWGKNQGIVFGPGRGSAAGSIISYALKITEIDPLAYDLLFERFLNPDRISMPDIDIDIQDSRRDEVINYCIEKYGDDRVANIVTFGRMAARNAVRDVARVLQVPYVEADRLAKMIPQPVQGRHIPLAISLKQNFELKQEYDSNETAKEVFDLAVQLEGTIRSHGVHAAGVVIAPAEIVKYTPLEMAQKGVVATQYSMGPIEELGLLKIDFLGLSNLTIIKNTLRIVKKVYKNDLDINNIPLDDPDTFKLLARGDTTGVFQFESTGMKRYLKELKPTVFEDVIAMVALYRPGPMQFIEDFITRKNDTKQIKYLHPKMKEALETTYGVLIYQEQVMQISKDLSGFSGGQADTLRKGIGKKIPSVLAKMKAEFIEGAIKHSQADRHQMEQFWKQLEDFAAYCFNKSHAACYAMIAYQTAYLKAHFPSAFMAALMTSDYDDTDRLAIEIAECKHMGIEVLPPDINESFVEFAVTAGKENQIRFGLSAVKNVGRGAVEEVLRARQQAGGQFKELTDFLTLVNSRIVNRKTLESLIKAGALDRFGDRSTLLENIDNLLAYVTRAQKQAASGQIDLFGELVDGTVTKAELSLIKASTVYSPRDQLLWERELLGLYLSQHPLQMYEAFLGEQTMPLSALTPKHDGRSVIVGGSIAEVREITTKNGQKMAFVRLEDLTSDRELVLFPGAYQQTAGLWQRDRVVLVRGKVSSRDRDNQVGEEVKIMVDDAREISIEQATSYQPTGKKIKVPAERQQPKAASSQPAVSVSEDLKPERVYIRIEGSNDQQLLMSLKTTIDHNQGEAEVVLVMGSADNKQVIKLPNRISSNDSVLAQLSQTVGEANIKVV